MVDNPLLIIDYKKQCIFTLMYKIGIKMKSITKFATFEDLKSHDRNVMDYSARLKKHYALEEFIKSLKAQTKTYKQTK